MSEPTQAKSAIFAPPDSAAVVRYQVHDLERARRFYVDHLGFSVTQQTGPIVVLKRGDLHLLLSGVSSSGARAMPDGRRQEPGGWNRIVLYVESLTETVTALEHAGARFRNQVERGPGGTQILVDDPDGNAVELHERPQA